MPAGNSRICLNSGLESLTLSDSFEGATPFVGKETISYSEAMELMETLQQMDKLKAQIEDAQYGGARKRSIRTQYVNCWANKALGNWKCGNSQVLEDAQYIRRKGSGAFELTPLGMRKIGEKLCAMFFRSFIKANSGTQHWRQRALGKRSEETKRFEFGDNFDIELKQTIMNALLRGQQKNSA